MWIAVLEFRSPAWNFWCVLSEGTIFFADLGIKFGLKNLAWLLKLLDFVVLMDFFVYFFNQIINYFLSTYFVIYFVNRGKHFYLLLVIIVFSNSTTHLFNILSSFSRNLSSLSSPLSFFFEICYGLFACFQKSTCD